MPKYIFVTGGVVSSVGKGITTAALGRILKSRNVSVSIQKLDPYLNVDPGTMSPYQHGEVFVTDRRRRDRPRPRPLRALHRRGPDERSQRHHRPDLPGRHREGAPGDFLGGTIQAIPHVTNEIKARVREIGREPARRWSSSRSAAPSVTSRASRSSRRSARSAAKSGPRTRSRIHVTFLPHVGSTNETEDEAHAALRPRAAQHGHPAGRHPLPQRPRGHGRDPAQDRALLRRRGARRHLAADDATASTRCRSSSRTRTSATTSIERLKLDAAPRPDLAPWRRPGRAPAATPTAR